MTKVVVFGSVLSLVPLMFPSTASAENGSLLPEPAPLPFDRRETPYGIVLLGLPADEGQLRHLLETGRDMGASKPQTLVYWWKLETMGGDYWKEMGYRPADVGETAWRTLDAFVKISNELGMRPSLRLGTFRVFGGLYHPMDKSGSVENYGRFLRELAGRYRGQVDHYVLGDEENKSFPQWGWVGTPENYLRQVFIPLATAIKSGDPQARVSATSVSSAPATDWVMQLVTLGLPKYGDGVAGNVNDKRIESLSEVAGLMERVRRAWPEARFYANGVGYADHHGLDDMRQAGIVAQCLFTLWDIGWDSAPYYTYTFSQTSDTKQNFGLMSPPSGGGPARFSAAWKAYQTVAQTFYNRREMAAPDFEITLTQAEAVQAADGTSFTIAPPDPVLRAFVRADRRLLIYLAYRSFREPRDGRWNVILETRDWGGPQQIPLLDYTKRIDLPHRRENECLVLENVPVGLQPTILTLRRRAADENLGAIEPADK